MDPGKKINNMERALRLGQMVCAMKVIMSTERSTERVLSNGQIHQCLLVSSTITIFTGKVFTCGVMVVSTRENGKTIKCMERGHSLGVTADCTLVSTSTTRRTVMANLCGLMVVATRATGCMVNSMVNDENCIY